MSSAPALPASSLRRRLLSLAVALVLAATVMLAVPGLRDVLVAIGDMRPGWVAVALALEVASCVSYVVVFRLAFEPLAPDVARAAAWSVMGSGALLPAGGVGGLAIGGWLLRVAGMPLESVLARASWVFCLTSVASGVVLVVAGTLLAAGLVAGPHGALLTVLPALAAAAAGRARGRLPHRLPRQRDPGARRRGRPRRWPDRRTRALRDAGPDDRRRGPRLPRDRLLGAGSGRARRLPATAAPAGRSVVADARQAHEAVAHADAAPAVAPLELHAGMTRR